MSPEKVVYSLLNVAGVTALVGTRFYSQTRPEGDALPAIVLSLISDVQVPPISASTGLNLFEARVQVSCFGVTSESAKTVADAVITACNFKSGTINGVTVSATFAERGADDYDVLTETYMQPVDVMVHYYR